MSDLKNRLIRLGSQNPELQKHLRPVLDKLSWGAPSSFSDFDRIIDMSPSTYLERYKYFDETGSGTFMPVRKDNPLDVGDIAHVCLEEDRRRYDVLSGEETANVEVLGVSMGSPPDHTYWKHGNIPYYDLKILDTGEEISRCSVDMQMADPYWDATEVSSKDSPDYVTTLVEDALKSEGIKTKRRRTGSLGDRTLVPAKSKDEYPPEYPYTSKKVKRALKSRLGLNFGKSADILFVGGPLFDSWKRVKMTYLDKDEYGDEIFDKPRWSELMISGKMPPLSLV